jgi:hypothetical protein
MVLGLTSNSGIGYAGSLLHVWFSYPNMIDVNFNL